MLNEFGEEQLPLPFDELESALSVPVSPSETDLTQLKTSTPDS